MPAVQARDSDLRGLSWPNGIATSDDNALHDIGRQTLRNDPNLAESPREPVIARRLGLNKVHDLSATEARVPRHRCACRAWAGCSWPPSARARKAGTP